MLRITHISMRYLENMLWEWTSTRTRPASFELNEEKILISKAENEDEIVQIKRERRKIIF